MGLICVELIPGLILWVWLFQPLLFMKHKSSTYVCYTGRFLAFRLGKKSPYQKLWLQVVDADGAAGKQASAMDDGVINDLEIKLGKSLRQMLVGYLEPYDWVKVAAKGKFDPNSGEMTWKACEVVKLSPRQVKRLDSEFSKHLDKQAKALSRMLAEAHPSREKKGKRSKPRGSKSGATSSKSGNKPVRVLICQKSGCRKRGSQAVHQAVHQALVDAGRTKTVKIQSTGCMKHCKAGPNMVVLPMGDKHRRVTPKAARSLIKEIL